MHATTSLLGQLRRVIIEFIIRHHLLLRVHELVHKLGVEQPLRLVFFQNVAHAAVLGLHATKVVIVR